MKLLGLVLGLCCEWEGRVKYMIMIVEVEGGNKVLIDFIIGGNGIGWFL